MHPCYYVIICTKSGFVYISHDLAALIEYLIVLCYRKFNNLIIEIVLYSYQFKR